MSIIMRAEFNEPGVNFVTPDHATQQLAYIRHARGTMIEAHDHKPIRRTVIGTQEVLHVRRGRLRVDFYDRNRNYVVSRVICEGDTIVLLDGGHGFEVLDDVELIEVKQGPYLGHKEKTRFKGVESIDAMIFEDENR